MPPVDAEEIKGFYMIWDGTHGLFTVAKADSSVIAAEIARYAFGDSGLYYKMQDKASTDMLMNVEILKKHPAKYGYISKHNCVVEYKTRLEIIDEILNEI